MSTFSPESRTFLLSGTRTAKLATVRTDGRSHVVPIWFDLDGDALIFMTGHTTVKAANMRHDLRVCLCVDDDTPPFAYLQIEGTAQLIIAESNELVYWATRIAGRYMGEALAETYGKRNGVVGELLVRVTPTKILFQQNIAG